MMYNLSYMKQMVTCYIYLVGAVAVIVYGMIYKDRNIGWIDSQSFARLSLICFLCEFSYIFVNRELFLSFMESIVM